MMEWTDEAKAAYGKALREEVETIGWRDQHLFALTRDTSWWCPAGDWYDTRWHLLPIYAIARAVNQPNPTWPGPAIPPRCLEIGVREGPTTMAILHAMRETGGKLLSLECDPDVAEITRGLVEKAGLSQWWELHVTRSEVFAPDAPPILDFLWIDGDHSEDQVRLDIENYAHRVRLGGFMALHDFYSDAGCFDSPQSGGFPSDVSIVVDDTIKASGKWEVITYPWSHGLTVCRRIR